MKIALLFVFASFVGQVEAASLTDGQKKAVLTIRALINSGSTSAAEVKKILQLVESKLLLLELNATNDQIAFSKKIQINRATVNDLKTAATETSETIVGNGFSHFAERIQTLNANDYNTTALNAHLILKDLKAVRVAGGLK